MHRRHGTQIDAHASRVELVRVWPTNGRFLARRAPHHVPARIVSFPGEHPAVVATGSPQNGVPLATLACNSRRCACIHCDYTGLGRDGRDLTILALLVRINARSVVPRATAASYDSLGSFGGSTASRLHTRVRLSLSLSGGELPDLLVGLLPTRIPASLIGRLGADLSRRSSRPMKAAAARQITSPP